MKAGLQVVFSLVLMACAAAPQTPSPGASSGSSLAKIFFKASGPERDVKRFQKFLDLAFDDLGMTLVDSVRDADATINMEIEREDKTVYLYAPVVWLTFVSAGNERFIASSCNTVSDNQSVFEEPIDSFSTIKLPSVWKKRGAHFVIYFNEPDIKGTKMPIPALKQGLAEDGYQITDAPAGADARLANIRLQRLSIPMQGTVVKRRYEVFNRQSKLMFSGSGSGEVTYKGVDPGIKLEVLPCNDTVKTFGRDSDGTWREASRIARSVRENLDKVHSN